MLAKLLKYELKSTARSFLPLYGGLVGLSIITAFFYHLQENMQWLFGIATALLFALMFGTMVFTLVVIIQRFYNNLLKDEGYLMFALPVKTGSLIGSKLIASVIWVLAGILVACISFIVFMFGVSGLSISEIVPMLKDVFSHEFAPLWYALQNNIGIKFGLIIEMLIAAIVYLVAFILQLYTAMSIGQLPPFAKHKVGFAVLAYIAIYVLIQMLLTPFGFMTANITPSVQFLTNLILISNGILAVVFYLVTYFILKKKLNLE